MHNPSPVLDSAISADSPTAPLLSNPRTENDAVAVQLRQPPDPAAFARMSTIDLRAAFLIDTLFVPGQVKLFYSHLDRAVIGAAVPGEKALLLPSCQELAAEYFTQRRELGLVNIGGSGLIRIGPHEFHLEKKESLYIGRGHREITFSSDDPQNPAQFYFVSYPAHTGYPCKKIDRARTEATELGSAAGSNRRTIHKVIHPAGIASCQLTMGYTELAEGSVWNTMPAHTHLRRSEIYLYFDLPGDGVVLHCLGEPRETRHIVVRDRQAVLSPPWSLHFGVGTTHYAFIWSMGGENQDFADMDMVAMAALM